MTALNHLLLRRQATPSFDGVRLQGSGSDLWSCSGRARTGCRDDRRRGRHRWNGRSAYGEATAGLEDKS